MKSNATVLSVLVGLVIPAIAVVVVPVAMRDTTTEVLGFPFLYFWIFLWFVLTTVLLAISWYVIDRPRHYELEEGREQ